MRNGLFGRFIGGMVLIGIGGVFLLNQLGVTDFSIGEMFSTYWPVFLILGGLVNLSNSGLRGGNFVGSAILILIGGYFLGRNLNLIYLSPGEFFRFFFPMMLIIGGLYVLFKPRDPHRRKRHEDFPPPPMPPLNPPPPPPTFHPEMESPLDSIFGSMEKDKEKEREQQAKQEKSRFEQPKFSQFHGGSVPGDHGPVIQKSGFIGDVHLGQDYFQLKPMNISHFIGDTIIDLTKAQIPYGETKINVSSFIGDVKVFVPDDMDIGIVATSSAFIGDLKVLTQKQGGFMTSVTAESPYYGEASKRVKLIVSVFVGDVKVNMVG
ncbi:MAG: cell wall-active antibiotics response protein [Paenibacillaceae bacterium]|uniref:Cell wall-active antibiotics response protein LiaF n=1 Tax=Paenibacillus mellifer TaxID=2937794 RepID=A0A9X1XVE6_9BACL|nr:cell wall-active antibiotics response protein LiaF [Paenibacillus mellifer]MBW4839948.1 cell wall-active antibiotics response protein [Paenibacillaceae bacterium]MCK8486027.1 cell wall-active antibiotics response protein LiaF [Paenibacillus mellifer]